MQEHLVNCDNLIKIYKVDDLEVVALQGLELEVMRGEMIALVGASGSGKTTLMNILGGLDVPSAGRCMVSEFDLTRLDEEQRTRYRNQIVGYLWQQSGRNLLPDLTIAANVDLPQMLNGISSARATQRTRELLETVGLGSMGGKRPFQLSGGEQQRAAIAVALSNAPALLLADEPTGELDSLTAQDLISLLHQINKELGQTVILVTHDTAVAARVDRTLAIRDGRTSTETIRRTPDQPVEIQVAEPETIMPVSESLEPSMPEWMQTLATTLLDLQDQLEIRFANDHVELWPVGAESEMSSKVPSGGTSSIIGLSLDSHRELVLVDRTGRLQLPKDALELIPTNSRAEVQVIGNRVILSPFVAGENGSRQEFVRSREGIPGKDGVR